MILPRKGQRTCLGMTKRQWLDQAQKHEDEARKVGQYPGPQEPYLEECERASYARLVAARLADDSIKENR